MIPWRIGVTAAVWASYRMCSLHRGVWPIGRNVEPQQKSEEKGDDHHNDNQDDQAYIRKERE